MKKRFVVRVAVVAVACLALFAVQACRKDNGPQQDAFLQKWRAVADQSQGHSPRDEGVPMDVDERNLNLEEGYEDVNDLLEDMEVERPLPKIPVSLEMRNANITAVLSALAKAANISMAISPWVGNPPEGKMGDLGNPEVTINVFKKPWDEVFKGLIKNHGLIYNWENGILSVKTFLDAERDVKSTALRARLMIQKILLKRAEPPVTRVVRIRYTKAVDIAAMIEKIVFHREADLSTEEEDIGVVGSDGGMESGSVLRERTDQQLDVTDEDKDTDFVDNIPGYVHPDIETNSVIVQAPRPVMKIVYYLIRKIDRPRKQIKIKAYIVETDSETARDLGIQWGGIYQYQHAQNDEKFVWMPGGSNGDVSTYYTPVGSGTGGSGPQSGRYTSNYGPGVSGQGYAANFPLTLTEAATSGMSLGFLFGTIGENILEAQLQALAIDDKVRILSSPSLSTQDNKEALLKDGMEIPYRSGFDAQGNAIISWREAVLALRITPHIISENALHMRIQIKKDELDFTLTNIEGIPVIRKKLAETELVTRNNETIVIGGLTRRRIDDSESGIPYLKDIPVLGYVFKEDLKDDQQQEVLIFITPKILDFWTPDDIQKSFEQIDRELKEDGIVIDSETNFIQEQ